MEQHQKVPNEPGKNTVVGVSNKHVFPELRRRLGLVGGRHETEAAGATLTPNPFPPCVYQLTKRTYGAILSLPKNMMYG